MVRHHLDSLAIIFLYLKANKMKRTNLLRCKYAQKNVQ